MRYLFKEAKSKNKRIIVSIQDQIEANSKLIELEFNMEKFIDISILVTNSTEPQFIEVLTKRSYGWSFKEFSLNDLDERKEDSKE